MAFGARSQGRILTGHEIMHVVNALRRVHGNLVYLLQHCRVRRQKVRIFVKWTFPNSEETHYDIIFNGKMKKREQAPERLRAVLYHETVHAMQYLAESWRRGRGPEAQTAGVEAYLTSYPETDAWLLTITQIILENARTANAKKAIAVNIENDDMEAFTAPRWGLPVSERNALEYYLADDNLRQVFKNMLWYALQEENLNEPV